MHLETKTTASTPAYPITWQPKSPVDMDTLSLKTDEWRCLEIALYFLEHQLSAPSRHAFFKDLSAEHVTVVRHFLKHLSLKDQIPNDFVASSNILSWLALALEVGITQDTLIMLSADEANVEQDMAFMDAKTEADYIHAKGVFYSFYRVAYRGYCHIAQTKPSVLKKLRQLLASRKH